MAVGLLSLCLMYAGMTSAARVLLLPFDHKGHVNTFSVAGKELQQRGHHVVIVTAERNRHIVEKHGITTGIFHQPIKSLNPVEDYKTIEESMLVSGIQQMWHVAQMYKSMTMAFLEYCREVVQDEETMSSLREQKFDIALVDGSVLGRCLYVLPYKLHIPHLTLNPIHEPWRVGIPAMPSSEGFIGQVILQSNPTLLTKVKNLLIYVLLYTTTPFVHEDAHISEMAPEMPETTYRDLYKTSGVHLVSMDNTCLDYPRLEAPHYHFIGGLGASPPKPLEEPFLSFAENAEHGVIVVSFGSFIKRVPEAMIKKMLPVFQKLQQNVIMRYDGYISHVPANVLLTNWLPQNDLLGHPKTRLFIAHGGLNGQMEALYHGVPMIVMPLAGDQMYSAQRAADKQYGVMLDPFTFTYDELHDAILQLLQNPVYADSIQKCSKISRSFPNAHDRIDFWIRHVLEFGSRHLKPLSVDMPLWELLMLDVMFVLLLVNILVGYLAYRCCKCSYTRCCRRNAEKSKTE